VRIYQGENSDALENIQLGEFRVEGLSDAPAGNPIILDLALDRDGILHVSAREKTTGLERRIRGQRKVCNFLYANLDES
jgi:molecular chaperone DnaK (HSP70)